MATLPGYYILVPIYIWFALGALLKPSGTYYEQLTCPFSFLVKPFNYFLPLNGPEVYEDYIKSILTLSPMFIKSLFLNIGLVVSSFCKEQAVSSKLEQTMA